MLKVVMKTSLPGECAKVCKKSMTIQRVQADLGGMIRAFVTLDNGSTYEHRIVNHNCELAKAFLNSGAIVLHAQVKEGYAFWVLACMWDEFKKLTSSLDDLKLNYEIISKTKFFREHVLTQREIEVLKLALDYGYFNNPKKVKLRELAGILNVSEATLSILIRKALKKVVEQAFSKASK